MKVSSPSFFLSAIETFRRTRIISKERSFIFNSFRYVDNCRIIVLSSIFILSCFFVIEIAGRIFLEYIFAEK